MAIQMNNRTKILAGVVVLLAAAAGAWFFLFQDNAPPPRTVVAPAAKTAPAAEAAKAPEAAKTDAAKAGEAPKAAAEAAKPAAKPIPDNPDRLIAEVIEASGIKTQFQAFSREALARAVLGEAKGQGIDPADRKAIADMVERAFEPGKLAAELAASLKTGADAERMSRFLEILRQPIAMKMNSAEMRSVTPEAVQEYTESFRKNPPPPARVKLLQALDGVTRVSESATEHATAIVQEMMDTVLGGLQKSGKGASKEARQQVGSRLNSMRNQMRAENRSLLYVAYRSATDQELADYVKLIDTDTGRWGMEQLANAAKPALVSRGSALGKESAQLALSKRASASAKAPAEPAPGPLAKAAPAEAPPPAALAEPVEPPGYQRAANVRELYSRYNDLITATVMRDPAAVKELLDDGKPLNVRQADGMTPLMIAAGNNDTAIAGMLLAKGADPNLRAPGGITALTIARTRGADAAALQQLLQRAGARD